MLGFNIQNIGSGFCDPKTVRKISKNEVQIFIKALGVVFVVNMIVFSYSISEKFRETSRLRNNYRIPPDPEGQKIR